MSKKCPQKIHIHISVQVAADQSPVSCILRKSWMRYSASMP